MSIVAGWYADPSGKALLRWWDGAQWTGWTHDGGMPATADVVANPNEVVQQSPLREGRIALLLGAADRIAVIDVETTGLFSADRVVEVAVVTIDRDGAIVDEFECLTNPMRDPGPTWLHGLGVITL